MPYTSKRFLRKIPKHEQELHINTNKHSTHRDISIRTPLISNYDYQAPILSHLFSPNSKWLIVRNNIHKIRSWGITKRMSLVDQPFQDWYLFFQMRRELKRAEEQIRALQYRPNFIPVQYFDLPIDEIHVRRYNVSHIQPTDGLYYAGLGSEPIVLQYLLYYFSKECTVPYNSMFYSFLCDVHSVLDTNRKRINRVVVFRKMALIMTLVTFIIILIMFFSLILSVITTTSNIRQMYKNDPNGGMKWNQSNTPRLTALIYGQGGRREYG